MELADHLAEQLRNLARDRSDNNFFEHGGVQLLVGLLHLGPTSKAAAFAASAVSYLMDASTAYDRVLDDAGAIAPLVALLGAGADNEAAKTAAGALRNLINGVHAGVYATRKAILDQIARSAKGSSCVPKDLLTDLDFEDLHDEVREIASELLEAAEAGTDAAALDEAIIRAEAVAVRADELRK